MPTKQYAYGTVGCRGGLKATLEKSHVTLYRPRLKIPRLDMNWPWLTRWIFSPKVSALDSLREEEIIDNGIMARRLCHGQP